MGIRGEPAIPADAAKGLVWTAIVRQIDRPESQDEFLSVADLPRERFHGHPWSIGGGGAAELKERLETSGVQELRTSISAVGRSTVVGEDDIWITTRASAERLRVAEHVVDLIVGESLRDWEALELPLVIYPYRSLGGPPLDANAYLAKRYLWPYRTLLANRSVFGKNLADMERPWYEHLEHYRDKLRSPLSIAFAFVATHNHFVLDRGGKIFNRSAPVIKLPENATEDDCLALLGLLNSSTTCFWMKQVFHDKGVGGIGGGIGDEKWEPRYEYDGTKLKRVPIVEDAPIGIARELDFFAQERAKMLPTALVAKSIPSEDILRTGRDRASQLRAKMIALQEELDWRCYWLYGVLRDDLCMPPGDVPAICLGERAFEIVLARGVAAGNVDTKWFERHGSTPITEIPLRWPQTYRVVVQRRIDAIEKNRDVALIEQPEYKRRWNDESWKEQQDRALRGWLLDQLETPSLWTEPRLKTVAGLADRMRENVEFLHVAELYTGRPDFDVGDLVAGLIEEESVPLLPVLRYKPSGRRKREAWEHTWDLQRHEDAIDARAELPAADPEHLTAAAAAALKAAEIGPIPVPPRYTSADFRKGTWWRLRGKLDVPKERFVSLPCCERDADPSLVMGWAGWNALEQSRAIAEYLVRMREQEGWTAERLAPLLVALLELLPWVRQYHNAPDAEFGVGMGDYFEGFIDEEARALSLTHESIRGWAPPVGGGRRGGRRKSST